MPNQDLQGQNVPAKFVQKFGGLHVGGRYYETTHSFGQHTPSAILYCLSEFFQSLTVRLGINCGACWHEINKRKTPFWSQKPEPLFFLLIVFTRTSVSL